MADRELIFAAAEKVMGWKVYQSGRCSFVAETPYHNEHILESGHPWDEVTWNPLASDSDAFMLVDALMPQWFFSLTSMGLWYAKFWQEKPTTVTAWSAECRDRRRAIVLAALKAVGAAEQVSEAAKRGGEEDRG